MMEVDTYPARSNKTDFLTRDGRAGDRRGLTDMLMVTTTVRMVDGVHSNTTSARPAANTNSASEFDIMFADKTHL